MLNGDIVNDIVVSPLQECRVDRADRPNPLGGEARRKRHGMSLRDSNVEKTVGVSLGESTGTGSAGHRSGDGNDLRILARQLDESLTKRCGVSRIRGGNFPLLTGGRVVAGGEGVPFLDVLASRKAFPFLSDAMNQSWTAHVAHRGERVHQHVDVVAVDRTEITKA